MNDPAPAAEGVVCPECGGRSRVRLAPGEACATCRSTRAWEEFGRSGTRLVVDGAALPESEARRSAESARTPLWRKALHLAPTATAAALGAVSVASIPALFRPVEIGPIDRIAATVTGFAREACLFGGAAAAAGIVALVLLRRGRNHRSIAALALAAASVLAGSSALAIGAFEWYFVARGIGWQRTTMPALAAVGQTPATERIMRATVTIVAPDADGDARLASIGAGAVIRTDAARAWIMTCSHVAMPYASAATRRDSASARTVWVYFSDGRDAPGRVRWVGEPPLDVAVLSVDLADAPEAAPVSRSADGVAVGDPATFVPNPFRSGWLVERGSVSRRDVHETTAGRFSLLFTTLPVQHGDSGTGLFDAEGRLIGINAWVTMDEGAPAGISLPSDGLAHLLDLVAREAAAEETR